jgi:membrane protease YdiL (CAAX protease family)
MTKTDESSASTTKANLHLSEVIEPEKKHKKLPWTPFLAVVFVLVLYFATQIVAGLLISIYPALQHWTGERTTDWLNGSVFAQFSYMVMVEAATLGGLWWFLRRHKSTFRDLGLTRRPRIFDPLLSVGGFVTYFAVYILLVAVMTHFVPALNVNQPQDVGFSNASGVIALSLTFISLVILPPVTEEILMRGFLFGSLRRKLPFIGAAVITSAIFASGHLTGGGQGSPLLWIAFIDTFILSLVLCYLREKTGRLWASIGVHMIKNGVAFVSLFLLHLH